MGEYIRCKCPKCGQNERMNVTIREFDGVNGRVIFKKVECAKCGEFIKHEDISDTSSLVIDQTRWICKQITLELDPDIVIEAIDTPDKTAYYAIKSKHKIKSEQISKWINLKNKSPLLNDPVLIYSSKYKEISVAYLRRSETTKKLYWQSIDYNPCCCDFDEVSHWMPLPKPPKEN